MKWAEIAIEAAPSATDAVGQCLSAAGCAGFVERVREGKPEIAGYLPVDDRLEDRLGGLKEGLQALPGFGIEGAGQELTIGFVEEEDWANAWKQFFKPIRVGQRLIVTPPWEEPDLSPGDIPIVIDPGMAFGTGSHATTQLCLEALEQFVKPGSTVSDIGTGSGILAIAARKLGAETVTACDIDPLAVRIARENAVVNRVSITFGEEMPDQPCGIVVANILADVIIDLREKLIDLLRPSGILIVSGIIDTRENDVRDSLVAAELLHRETTRKGEWVALVFERAA